MKGDIRLDKKRERVRRFLRKEGILPPYGQTLNDEQQKIWNQISNNNFTYYNEIKESKKKTTEKVKKSRYVIKDGIKKRKHTEEERPILKKERLLYEARQYGILPISKEDKLNKQQQEIYDFICDNPEIPIRSFLNLHSHLTTPEHRLWYRAKRSSYRKSYKYDFNIEVEDIQIPEKCPYLNIPILTDFEDTEKDNYYSIDRIDSTKGYVKGNIQVISLLANTMKNKSTQEQLLTFSKNVLLLHNS